MLVVIIERSRILIVLFAFSVIIQMTLAGSRTLHPRVDIISAQSGSVDELH